MCVYVIYAYSNIGIFCSFVPLFLSLGEGKRHKNDRGEAAEGSAGREVSPCGRRGRWDVMAVVHSEKRVEKIFTDAVKKMGGMAVKFTSPGLDGVPDRIVLLPGRKIAFVELKAPGKKPRPLQEKRMRQLKSLGFHVYVIDGVEQIGGVLDEICAT